MRFRDGESPSSDAIMVSRLSTYRQQGLFPNCLSAWFRLRRLGDRIPIDSTNSRLVFTASLMDQGAGL